MSTDKPIDKKGNSAVTDNMDETEDIRLSEGAHARKDKYWIIPLT